MRSLVTADWCSDEGERFCENWGKIHNTFREPRSTITINVIAIHLSHDDSVGRFRGIVV